MFKKLLAFFVAMTVAIAFAAVDVNKATPAELDGIKGIGPSISTKIVDERKKGNFKSWEDFIERVKGVGHGNAVKFSAEGLTVGGAGYKGAAAAPAKKDDKLSAAKTDAKPAAAPAVVATPVKADPKPAAAASAVKEEKKDPKVEAQAKKDAKVIAKADEKKAKADVKAMDAKPDAKSDAKADAAKAPASAAKK